MSESIASINLINAIKKINKPSENNETMIFGTVKKISPLQIQIKNNIIIDEEFLFLGQMCRPHKVKIPHTHELNGNTEIATTDMTITTVGQATTTVVDKGHKHDIKKQITEDVHAKNTDFEESVTIEIEPKLKEGDKVLMFAFNNFQMFYVAERLEEEK